MTRDLTDIVFVRHVGSHRVLLFLVKEGYFEDTCPTLMQTTMTCQRQEDDWQSEATWVTR